MKDVREGTLSSKKVFNNFGGIVEKNIVIRTNVFATKKLTVDNRLFNMSWVETVEMKLRSMQRAHERIMLNITWRDHKTAEWIREQTKLRDILETISKAKWTWAGHLTRRTDNRWTTKLTFWQPRGHTRNKGRPKFRWRDDLDKFRKHWHRDESDRLRWRQMGKAYVQLRTFKGWPGPGPGNCWMNEIRVCLLT